MSKKLPPFASTFSPGIPKILKETDATILLSTYQAGKVIFLSAVSDDKLVQLPRTFDSAMGIATNEGRVAVACKNEVVVLANAPGLAAFYPVQPKTYDALFVPRAVYFTGQLALHDMHWSEQGLLAINTLFSCISVIDDEYSFKPIWQPSFIEELAPEDRCHLNGMAINENGDIEFVTALGTTNKRQGWRENKMEGGVLVDVKSNKILFDHLAMPHSPRLYNDKLYFLISALGQLVEADIQNREYKVIAELGGFARGMEKIGDYLFIGISKLRHTTEIFADLPIAKSSFAGVVVYNLAQRKVEGKIKYHSSVEEIYDVKILSGMKRPGILNYKKDVHQLALVTPTDSFWASPEPKNK